MNPYLEHFKEHHNDICYWCFKYREYEKRGNRKMNLCSDLCWLQWNYPVCPLCGKKRKELEK